MGCKLALYSVIVMYTMTLSASADYTEELQSVFVDEVIFDCGDWSAVQNPADGTLEHFNYNYDDHKSYRWNRARMCNPSWWGLPGNTRLHPGPMLHFTGGGQAGRWVEWVCIHSVGITPELRYDGATYSNESATFSYRAAWLRQPYRCSGDGDCLELDQNIDEVTCIPTTTDGKPAVRLDVKGHWTTPDDEYPVTGSKTILLNIDDVMMWQSVNPSINVSISNFTDRCTVLSVETPAGITGIRIDATSQNTTAFYEKHGYYMELNETESGHQFFDLREHVFEKHSNMSPIGVNLYSLPRDDYNISVTLYTPFEVTGANISIVETDLYATDAPESPVKQVLCLLVVLSGLVFLGRSI